MGGLDAYEELFGKAAFPMVSATYTERGGTALFAPAHVVKEYELAGRRTFRIAFLSLETYNSVLARTGSSGKAIVSRNPADQARRHVPVVAGKADLVVLLAGLDTKDVQRVGETVPGAVHLALATFADRISPDRLEEFGGIPTLYGGDQGKRLGEVRIFLEDGKVSKMTGHLVHLTKRYVDDPKIRKMVEAALVEVNELMKQMPAAALAGRPGAVQVNPGGPSAARRFLTSSACRDCHEEAYRVWEHSVHARAMATLVKANQDFNPECVRCHTTGFGTPEGFQTARATPTLANVHCEACHGSAALHVLDAARPYGRVQPRVCYTCHTKENSPEFSFFKYWEEIKH